MLCVMGIWGIVYAVCVIEKDSSALPGLQRDGKGKALGRSLLEQGLAALQHEVEAHRLCSRTLSEYSHL